MFIRSPIKTEKSAEDKRVIDIMWEVEALLRKPVVDIEKARALCEERNSLIREGKAKNRYFKLTLTKCYMRKNTDREYRVVSTEKEIQGEILTGETFSHKEAIKAKGGKWIAGLKAWEVPAEVHAELYELCNA